MIDTAGTEPVTLNGSCHCGAVRFTAELPLGLSSARRCTCSICRMRGAVAVTSTPQGFHLLQGEEQLGTYRFNTRSAEHHFCTVCGIYTHHKRRSNPDQFGVNVACLEGLSPFDFREIVVFDGDRHPADNAEHKTYAAGVLRFEPATD
ncbi:GFA family protein [Sphingomonas daechungensis]|uniref:GFA family protein n=1 Tax=Sphingomonas daechungensis TaxID=1176646 RepID=UPI0037830976